MAEPHFIPRLHTMHPEAERTTPADFPRDQALGAVSGVQPKLLIRKVGDTYIHGLTPEELYARYDTCFDLVNQLEDYCRRKLNERPEWSALELFEKVRASVSTRHDWGLSAGEEGWVMFKLCLRMRWPPPHRQRAADDLEE
jgi:hypothetical protein